MLPNLPLHSPFLYPGEDSLLDEMIAQGEKKKIPVKRVSRQGVFATQFIENTKSNDSNYLAKHPPGRTRGSMEFKIDDIDLRKVGTDCVCSVHTHTV